MASDHKVINFPNKINRSRLIGPLEADTVAVVGGSFIFFYFLINFLIVSSLVLKLIVIASLSLVVSFLYVFYKKNAKKGFLLHWLYIRSIYLPKYKGYENLPQDFLPKGYEYEFRD